MNKILKGLSRLGFSPKAWCYFIRYNFLSKHVRRNDKMKFLWPNKNAFIQFEKDSLLVLNGNFLIGTTQLRNSRMEARLLLQEGGSFIVGEDGFEQFAGMFIRVMPHGQLEIGGLVANEGCQITAGEKIQIGTGCLFARDVKLRSDDVHKIIGEDYRTSQPITLGNHVWVGQGASIMKGVTIGDGAIVAASALVLKDVPANTLVGGVPARVIRENVKWEA